MNKPLLGAFRVRWAVPASQRLGRSSSGATGFWGLFASRLGAPEAQQQNGWQKPVRDLRSSIGLLLFYFFLLKVTTSHLPRAMVSVQGSPCGARSKDAAPWSFVSALIGTFQRALCCRGLWKNNDASEMKGGLDRFPCPCWRLSPPLDSTKSFLPGITGPRGS